MSEASGASRGEEAPRVLVVEHDEVIRETLTLALEALGCVAVAVDSGPATLEAIGGQVFAAAIIESRLVGALSGSETLQALKLQLPSLPVVLLAEPDHPADVLAAFHAGAADVLLKPFEIADLRAALARALVKSDEAGIDFHGRLELAKTALAERAFDVAGVHLRAALGKSPLDAEALNLYGVARELAGDVATGVQAYRAAFACDPNFARARENLERASDQFTYIGLLDDSRMDLFLATAARIAVPVFDPLRDLPLIRLAEQIGGASIGVAVGVLLEPPTGEEGAARTVARRRGFVRPAGRTLSSVPCMVDYAFANDRVVAARRLREEEKCELLLIGEWLPETVRAGILDGGAGAVVTRVSELPAYDAVQPEIDATALAVAINLAQAANAQLVLPPSLVESLRATTVPVHALFAQVKLQRPRWTSSESYVSVSATGENAITVGRAAEATLRLV